MSSLFVFYRRFKIKVRIYLLKRQGLKIGSEFRCMGGVNFGSEPYLIKFGNRVTISFDVVFVTHDGATWVYRDTEYSGVTKYAPISVGNNCFIGCRAIFLPGSGIGNNCIVAAGSVVTKKFPDGVLIGGVPAKEISTTASFIERAIEENQRVPSGTRRKEVLLSMFERELQVNE